ncbi:MAG: nucleotide pyrophosphatase/phosphodiesterase family protein [Planctomycetota bacterium]
MKKKIVIVLNVVGLSPALMRDEKSLPHLTALKKAGTYRAMSPGFPAVTSSVQATLLTGKPPADHGIVGNGYFDRLTMKPEFWRQENGLVNGPRIWDIMRERNPSAKVAVVCWQNSKYINADIAISPSPLHTDSGMVEWCYSKPAGFYETLSSKIGPFRLMDYWGPMAGEGSSRWITKASLEILRSMQPEMLLAYLPHLDYFSQRFGPNAPGITEQLRLIDGFVGEFINFRNEYGPKDVTIFIVSEYGLVPVNNAVLPNLILRENGLLKVRDIGGKEYIDFELSDAFAVVDHQITHIYCSEKTIPAVKKILGTTDGITSVLDRSAQRALQINHPRSGDIIALTVPDQWFAYYYWNDNAKAPFYARTVDIHNKPGYDPCELFFDPSTKSIPLNPGLVKGSHGLPAEKDEQYAVMMCSDKAIDDYAPQPFNATQFLAMLYRVV